VSPEKRVKHVFFYLRRGLQVCLVLPAVSLSVNGEAHVCIEPQLVWYK